ncbi:uncharacterized protein LOC142632646 [Castanea sativa]|uniref:uncharacterized protein LOC142632646 n=1 Tax=Castanea sativa TaxID=21020 RepID=UPI003F64BBBF
MVINDPNCVICNEEVESPCHVFLTCPMAKALWFATCWGLKAGEMNISTPVDIVKLILEPRKALCLTREKWSVSLNMALILEEIWSIRNLVSQQQTCGPPILAIQRKFNEHSIALARAPPAAISVPQPTWSPSPPGLIKINVVAALSSSHAALAAVARDHPGVPVKMWARITKIASPLLAEAETLLWSVQLAITERWNHVIVEGDAKTCFDAVNSPNLPPPWTIQTSIDNILTFQSSLESCSFVWIKRDCNSVAHGVAKLALSYLSSFFFYKDNLPPALLALCKEDYSLCSSFFF